MESLFDFLVIVISSEKNRLERLAQRGLTTEQATARMSKQVSDDERKAAADFLIVNDGNLDQLEADVEKIWQTLQERSFKS
jgi:dephospho-CoA kinase